MRIPLMILATLLVVALAGLGVSRWLRTGELERGGGSVSPNGLYLSKISGVHQEDFWGYKREFYRLQIYPRKKIYPDGTNYQWELHPIADISVLNPSGQDLLMHRGTEPFPSKWLGDSTSLEIDVFGSTVTLYTSSAGVERP